MSKQNKMPPQVIRLSVIGLVIVGVIAFKVITSNIVEKRVDKILGSSKQFVTYDDASMDMLGFAIHLNNVKVQIPNQEPLKIDEIVINDVDTKNLTPHYMNIEVKGIENDLTSLATSRKASKALATLDYKKIKSDLKINYAFNKEKKLLDIKDVSLNVKNAGEISYRTELYNVSSLESLAMQMNFAPQSVKFGKTSLRYEDDSLTNRIFKLIAEQSNKDVNSFKAEIVKNIERNIQRSKTTSKPYEEKINEAMLEFVKNPKSFEFKISPEKPVSLASLRQAGSQEEFLKSLNLKISAN